MAKRIAELLNGVPDRKPPRRPRRRVPMAVQMDEEDDDLSNLLLNEIDPAMLLEMFNASLAPREREEFRAKTKGISQAEIRRLLMGFLEQAQLQDQMNRPPGRKTRK